jgi:hypothetical protein
MTITVDLATEDLRTGTTNPQTWSHGGASSGVKGVVIAILHGSSSTDHVTATAGSVTYGGSNLTRIVRATDTAGEAGAAELWFLGSSVPQGTQTVSYANGGSTDDFHAVCITLLGDSNLEIIDFDSVSENTTNPQVTLQYSAKTGTSAMAFGALYSGATLPSSLGSITNCVSIHDAVVTASSCTEVQRQTTAQTGTGDFTIGFTVGTDDVAYVAMVVAEMGAATFSGSGSGTLPIATASGVGKRSLKSTGSATLPKPTATGVGKRSLKATGTATLPLATASGAGKKTRSGSGSATLPLQTASGVGKRDLKSTGSATLPLATASGSGSVTPAGTVEHEGSGSGTLPLLTGSGAAVRALKATGAATLPVLTSTGVGSRVLLGSGEATLPLLTASGQSGEAVAEPEAEEERSGGYGWANLAAIERRRRKREEEELADALEVAMAAEGLIEPDPVVAARHVVRDYVKTSPPASRRMQRAVEYAYRAQSDLAWQLAAREIARQEEEDFALLMVIAFAA